MYLTELINIGFFLCLVANATLFLPQAFKILRRKSAKGVSLITFGGMNIIQLSTILHGYLVRDWLLVIGMWLAFATCGFVTTLILLYRD